MLLLHTVATHASRAELSLHEFFASVNFCSRALAYDSAICAKTTSAFLIALSRSEINSARIADMYSSHPVASTPHAEKNLSKSASASHARKSDVQRFWATTHARMSHLHDDCVFFLFVFSWDAAIFDETPAAVQDCSIKLSYASDTSSVVQPAIFFIHCAVAQA